MIVSIAEEMNPARRNTMEDVHVFHGPSTWDCPDSNATFIGVYDGHGGRSIVDFLEDHLASNLAKEWKYFNGEQESHKNRGQKRKSVGDDCDVAHDLGQLLNEKKSIGKEIDDEGKSIRTSLESAFLLTDIQSHMAGITTSGATVACCIVVPKFAASDGSLQSISIHSANVGDARAVLSSSIAQPSEDPRLSLKSTYLDATSSSNSAVRLTHDHKATDPNEIDRIISSGGMMIRGRVLGILAVARSLGDHGLKEFVIGRPHLSTTVIRIEKDNSTFDNTNDQNNRSASRPISPYTNGEFLIVACDGLWDVMEDQESVDLVRKFISGITSKTVKQKQQEAAQFLVNEALQRGSTDNITVIVYWL